MARPSRVPERARFEILLEEVRSALQTVAEGHGSLVQRMDRLEQRMDRLEQRLDRVEQRLDLLERRVDALENAVLTGFREVRRDIQQLAQRLDLHEQVSHGGASG